MHSVFFLQGSSCEVCPAGYYCPDPSQSPKICPLGTYSLAGNDSCESCPAGRSCINPGESPINCDTGTYSPLVSVTTITLTHHKGLRSVHLVHIP